MRLARFLPPTKWKKGALALDFSHLRSGKRGILTSPTNFLIISAISFILTGLKPFNYKSDFLQHPLPTKVRIKSKGLLRNGSFTAKLCPLVNLIISLLRLKPSSVLTPIKKHVILLKIVHGGDYLARVH